MHSKPGSLFALARALSSLLSNTASSAGSRACFSHAPAATPGAAKRYAKSRGEIHSVWTSATARTTRKISARIALADPRRIRGGRRNPNQIHPAQVRRFGPSARCCSSVMAQSDLHVRKYDSRETEQLVRLRSGYGNLVRARNHPSPDMFAQRSVAFELLLREQLLHCGLVRKGRVAGLVGRDVVVLVPTE